jgi:hypothetical protein
MNVQRQERVQGWLAATQRDELYQCFKGSHCTNRNHSIVSTWWPKAGAFAAVAHFGTPEGLLLDDLKTELCVPVAAAQGDDWLEHSSAGDTAR